MEQPNELTEVKVIRRGLLTRIIYAVDEAGNVWRGVEGYGPIKWVLFKQAG